MVRRRTTKDVFSKRAEKPIELLPSALKDAIGGATLGGCWLVYGSEKNGKTWFVLKMAKELARFTEVHYISAEEGLKDSFRAAMKRAGITTSDKIYWDEYLPVFSDAPEKDKEDEECIVGALSKQRSAKIVIIDNLTMYADEFKKKAELKKRLMDALPNKLVIFVAHEERKEAYPAIAKHAKKMANVIFHVVGLKAFVTSRFDGGGELIIDEEKCEIYHGN